MTARWAWAPLCVVALTMLLALPAMGPGVDADESGFGGLVSNMGSGLPVAGARVAAGGCTAITDARGRYALALPPGTYEVHAEAEGYVGMTHSHRRLDGGGQATLDFEMIPRHPTPEEAAIIDARMMIPSQEPPSQAQGATLSRGYGLSSVVNPPATIRVLMPDGTVVVLPMDEYLKGVVPHEMPPYWPAEALKAQAVAARSYASTRRAHLDEGADVCTTTHCQVWNATHYDTTDQAVDDTHGTVARYGGSIIYAFFFAHCDGHTRDVEEVWGGDLPYCRSVACPCGYTYRYGHGVGMCQHGARVLAQQGHSYVDILKHYYTGIEVASPAPGYLTGVSLEPASGDANTQFTFQATYACAIGDLPAVANVIIDDRAYALTRVSGTPEGGTLYELVTRLPAGEHTYLFYFDDGRGQVARVPYYGALNGPSVSEPDPATPTPTPVPTPDGAVLAESIVHSTTADWAEGSFSGVSLVLVGDGALALASGHAEGVYTSAMLVSPLPFVGLGVVWHGSRPNGSAISLEVRTSADGVNWGEWRPVGESEDDQRSAPLASDLLFGQGIALQYRVTLQAGWDGASPTLENLRLVCIDSRPGPTAAELAASRSVPRTGPPPVVSRSAWGADESIMTWAPEYRSVRAIVLHHTATSEGDVDPAAMVRAIYYYHSAILERGDLGYNYLVDSLGNIYEGRAGGAGVVAAHAQRFDWGSIGVALVGDYSQQDPSAAMRDGLVGFLAWQCSSHSIDPLGERVFIDAELPTIMGHRDCGSATCPGDRVYALLPTIRSETWAEMAGIDGTAPEGSASAPEWSNVATISFVLTSTDAVAVQFSNNWVWEGEELRFQEQTGHTISDTAALNGWARVGRVGDPDYGQAGYWYGPYTCELPSPGDYQVYFRLKNPNSSAQVQLANLDVADNQGHRIYAARTLVGTDFAQDDVYQEFRLDVSYGSREPTCAGSVEDGLEFRTEFLGMGDLFLDRVTVFAAPQSLTSTIAWEVRAAEGPQTVTVRFLDAAGNSSDCPVIVRLDMTPPEWSAYQAGSVVVQDALSGLDTSTATWATSPDAGATWGAWQPITLTAASGITQPVELVAPQGVTTCLRFRIRDLAGNPSQSEPLGVPPTDGHGLMLPLILRPTHAGG